jgi:replication factor C large subunit
MTAENPYDQKFSKLRSRSEVLAFESLPYTDIYEKLRQIAEIEGIAFEEMALRSLARRAGGDMRAAINDLQSLSLLGKVESAELEMLGDREQKETIVDALLKILKTRDPNIALSALEYVNEDYDQVMLWLDENMPVEYRKPEDLARAYDKLSKADVFQRRIRRWQHWRFLVYIQALLTAGIAMSKDEKYKEFVSYKPSGRILKIWMANQKNAKKKAIAEKLAAVTHTSAKKAYHDLPYIQRMCKDKAAAEKIIVELDLTDDEKTYLLNQT